MSKIISTPTADHVDTEFVSEKRNGTESKGDIDVHVEVHTGIIIEQEQALTFLSSKDPINNNEEVDKGGSLLTDIDLAAGSFSVKNAGSAVSTAFD